MRILLLATFGLVAGLSLGRPGTAAAQPVWYPWCSHYSGADYGGAISCGYLTFEQCLATVSGIGGTCERNVWPPPPPVARSARRRQSQ